MLHNRKPNEWEVFNNPSRYPVKYYSILKRNREFSQLIRQYDAQVFKHGYFHYCSIVPKNISSALNNKYELFIVFWDKVPDTSFIGFRIKVSKETFIDESNSLLLFLKKIKKPVFYLINNNYIHVQCGENAWELFYLLYDAYLRQFVVTVIGTQFFYNFVYSFCIQREVQLLELLFKGSKVIRISKKSIYYKIHRKRKISISNLVHMILNMPQSKKHIITFNSKVSMLHCNIENDNFYTCSGSKIHVSKLFLKKFKNQIINSRNNAGTNHSARVNDSALKNIPSYPLKISDSKNKQIQKISSCTQKRKLEEIENDSNDINLGPTSSKFLKTSESVCRTGVNNQWEHFRNVTPYTVTSYSDIPCLKYFVPNLLSNGKSSHVNNSHSYLCKTHSYDYVPINEDPLILSNKDSDLNNKYLTYEKPCAGLVNISRTTETYSNVAFTPYLKGNTSSKLIDVHTSVDCSTTKSISSYVKAPDFEKHQYLDSQNIRCSISDNNTSNSLSLSENFCKNNINTSDDVSFITAAGKGINFSNTALITACRLMGDVCDDEKQQELPSKSNFDSKKKKFKRHSIGSNIELCRKSGTENTCDLLSYDIKHLKGNDMTSKNIEAENIHENFQPNTSSNVDGDVFSTAAGKTIKLSNAALQAAEKLMQNAIEDESVITPTVSNYNRPKKTISKNFSAFRDIGFSLKKSVVGKIDVDMDKTLVEKFFEDTVFGEKELTTSESRKENNVDVIVESKSVKNPPVNKPRKSLGGRRNMRFCSDAL